MNVETGEIKDVDKLTEKERLSGKWVELERRPNPGCKRCHGRGHLGRDVTTDQYVLCRCVKKRPKKKVKLESAKALYDTLTQPVK